MTMADTTNPQSTEQTYFAGKAVAVHESDHHIVPLKIYYAVFGGLILLTVLTVLVSYANLGAASLPVAVFIAIVKAALVAGFFMHLRYGDRFNAFIFFGSVLFVAIFFVLTLADITTRDDMQAEWGNQPHLEDKINSNADYKKWRTNYRSMDHGH